MIKHTKLNINPIYISSISYNDELKTREIRVLPRLSMNTKETLKVIKKFNKRNGQQCFQNTNQPKNNLNKNKRNGPGVTGR